MPSVSSGTSFRMTFDALSSDVHDGRKEASLELVDPSQAKMRSHKSESWVACWCMRGYTTVAIATLHAWCFLAVSSGVRFFSISVLTRVIQARTEALWFAFAVLVLGGDPS